MAYMSSAAEAASLILLSLLVVGVDAFLINNKRGSQRFPKLLLSVFWVQNVRRIWREGLAKSSRRTWRLSDRAISEFYVFRSERTRVVS